jgi:MFS family permease
LGEVSKFLVLLNIFIIVRIFKENTMQTEFQPPSENWRTPFWIALLTLASVAFSLGFACATPFAAFAAAAALSLPRKHALWLVGATWLANQIIGYGLLNYPQSANSFTWGAVIGAAALLATFVCSKLNTKYEKHANALHLVLIFAAGVLVYQLVMLVALFTPLGDIRDFNAGVITRIVLIDVGAFIGLLAVNVLGRRLGLLQNTINSL